MKAILFKARHEHKEIDGLPAIFPDGVNPLDFWRLYEIASEFMFYCHDERVDVYVTGLTSATVAVIKAAVDCKKDLALWHYDRDTDCYKPQHVVTAELQEQGQADFGVYVPISWTNS